MYCWCDMSAVRDSIEDVQYVELKDADHAVVFSDPSRVMDVVLPFLEDAGVATQETPGAISFK